MLRIVVVLCFESYLCYNNLNGILQCWLEIDKNLRNGKDMSLDKEEC